MYAFTRLHDPLILSLSEKPSGEAVTEKTVLKWQEQSAKAKSNIVLCFGHSVFMTTIGVPRMFAK